jgi:uncharacterized repeat protein (TIGR03803 family)
MVACALLGGATLAPLAANAATLTTLYAFEGGSDGSSPQAALINVGGTLYGTASAGGRPIGGGGTVFAVNPVTGAESVLHAFHGGNDGRIPLAALINVGGMLYGTTEEGGASEVGTVFSINPATGVERVVYAFKGGSDGQFPLGALINVGGTLYGTTSGGGGGSQGTVFSIDPTTGAERVVYAFNGASDGGIPSAPLISVGGTLYGTAGTNSVLRVCSFNCGTVFSIYPTTGAETTLYSFMGGSDGQFPHAAVINVGGTLYGTTELGGGTGCGGYGCGTVFSVNPTSGENVLHAFQGGSDGSKPQAALIKVGATLYGTTAAGGGTGNGGSGFGTVFSINPSAGENVVYAFQGGGDGETPFGSLINVGGTLYGTTYLGGAGYGTVFKLTP